MPVNFRRDPVDWCEGLPPEPNQAEDLESFLRENRTEISFALAAIHAFILASALPQPSPILPQSCRFNYQFSDETYLATPDVLFAEMIPWRALLVARTCWGIGEPRLAVGEDMVVGRYSGPPNLGG